MNAFLEKLSFVRIKRTPLSERTLPAYTRGEEITNMILLIRGAKDLDPWRIVSASIYGASMILVFTVSSVYHGLKPCKGKLILRIIDHCNIFFMIAGTYTPILLAALRPVYPGLSWTVFGLEWGFAALGIILNAIDLKKFERLSMICYLAMGWGLVLCLRQSYEVLTPGGFFLILSGGIFYSAGAALYVLGRKKRYIHSVFHVFVVAGAALQFFGILFYVY